MVEARARIPGCRRLKAFTANGGWLDRGSLATRIQLLRTLLPSLQRLVGHTSGSFTWNAAFEPCFIETRPPFLEALWVRLVDDETVPSRDVLEAALGLREIHLEAFRDRLRDRALQPIMAVLRHGIGLQNLEKISLSGFDLDDVLFIGFFNALKDSGCAKRMVELSLKAGKGVGALADLLRREAFPALEVLHFEDCVDVTDEGVVALAEALRDAQRTCLRDLKLSKVGMCDADIGALASAIQQGRMRQLELLCLSFNNRVTDDGLIALARAIDMHGLPELKEFAMEG